MTQFVGDYSFDARPDRIDLRDRPYAPPLRSLPPQFPSDDIVSRFFPRYLKDKMVLNQGRQGACTGFGLACTINYLLWRRGIEQGAAQPPDKVSPRMLYHLARFYDEWPGEDYQGSSCRGAIKAWHKHGVCTNAKWPYRARFTEPQDGWDEDAASRPLGVYYRIERQSIVDMQAAIQDVGAIYVSAQVHAGWNLAMFESDQITHDTLPVVSFQPGMPTRGGHAFAFVGYNARGFIVQNSWGRVWGYQGFAVMTYEDWLENGSDAWVCVMGAPTRRRVDDYFVSSSASREQAAAPSRQLALPGAVGRAAGHVYQDAAVAPWDQGTAYRHCVVMGNDGRALNRLVTSHNGSDAVRLVMTKLPGDYFLGLPANEKQRLVLYVHGGLNSEADSIERIRVMAPYFKANSIYPVFLSWKTGLLETLLAITEDAANRLFPKSQGLEEMVRDAQQRVADALDRTLEVASENLGVKAIWSQMKQNAVASAGSDGDRGAFLAVKALADLRQRFPAMELHLIGHSAGSLVIGHMLDDLQRLGLNVSSCTLFAAACSVEFAIRHYVRAIDRGVLNQADLHLHMLSDRRERGDSVGPYRKSLLYLVSRALEERHKTPLLGMANAFDPSVNPLWSPKAKRHLEDWQAFWGQPLIPPHDEEQVVSAASWTSGRIERVIAQTDSAHGAFDNDVVLLDQMIRRMRSGQALLHAVENLRY